MIISDNSKRFQVIWDLGRRCTYACTYCPPHRNNKWSPKSSFASLERTLQGIHDYIGLIESFRDLDHKYMRKLSFTGGEPTIHDDLWPFLEMVAEKYPEYSRGITTNGYFGDNILQKMKDLTTGGTISYHPEATPEQKKRVVENIFELKDKYFVNVMFHKDYFDECKLLSERLKNEGVNFSVRPIGDDGDDQTSIDKGYTHVYTDTQQQYFNSVFGREESLALGRGCCGKRKFSLDGHVSSRVDNTNFFGYSCFNHFYFLYINSELDRVWTHQTCGVNWMDGTVKPLGTASSFGEVVDELSDLVFRRRLPIVKCPKTYCGCGMCTDKTNRGVEPFMTKWIEGMQPHFVQGPPTTTNVNTVREEFAKLDTIQN